MRCSFTTASVWHAAARIPDNVRSVALPKTSEPPARIQIQRVEPQVDCGRYPVKRTVGDRVEVTARIFRDGHDVLGAAVRSKAPGASRWGEASLEPLVNDEWRGSFPVDRPGVWQFRIEAWVDRVASFQDELRRKVAAGQEDLAGELSEGAVLLGKDGLTIDEALAAPAGDRSGKASSQVYCVDVDRELARFGSWYELFPRSWGGFDGVRALLPRVRGARLRRALPAADPSDRPHEPQGPQQRAEGAARRSRQPVGDRQRARRPRRDRSGARHRQAVRAARQGREEARHRDRARLRHPVLARPSVADRAPGVVPPSPGRDAEVRGEPAEALPGHLQRQLRLRGLARSVEGAARRRARLGRARRHRLPRRQPAHEAARVLGVADRRGARRESRRDLPLGGVHAADDDDDAREGRLLAELHVLHVEEHALGAAGVHRPAARLVRVLPPERLREHAGHPARVPAERRPARVRGAAHARRDALAVVRDLLRVREPREHAGARRAARSTGTRRSTR